MSKKPLPLASLFTLTFMLAACGQKGPLYLPQDPAAQAQPAAAVAAPAEGEEQEPQAQADETTETNGEPALEK